MVREDATRPPWQGLSFQGLQALVLKKKEAWISRILYRRLSVPLTWLLLRTPATPNAVTWAGALVGVAAVLSIANPWNDPVLVVAGLLGFQLSIVLDHVDGELARAKAMQSPGGWFLDNFAMEILLHLLLTISLPLAVFFQTRDDAWLLVTAGFGLLKALGIANFLLKAVVDLRQPGSSTQAPRVGRPGPLTILGERYWEVKKIANTSFFLLLIDLLLWELGVLPWVLLGHPLTLVGAYVLLGIPVLGLSLLLDVWHASRGRYTVDLDPYK